MPRRPAGVPPKKRGPRGKLAPELVEQFIAHIREGGLWRDDAARLVGLGTDTIDGWIRKGRKNIEQVRAQHLADDSLPELDKFGRFVKRLEAAESEVQARMVGIIVEVAHTADDPETRARWAAWYLARRDNLRYGSGSQRADLLRLRTDDDDNDDDVGEFVMDALGKWESLEALAETHADKGV